MLRYSQPSHLLSLHVAKKHFDRSLKGVLGAALRYIARNLARLRIGVIIKMDARKPPENLVRGPILFVRLIILTVSFYHYSRRHCKRFGRFPYRVVSLQINRHFAPLSLMEFRQTDPFAGLSFPHRLHHIPIPNNTFRSTRTLGRLQTSSTATSWS